MTEDDDVADTMLRTRVERLQLELSNEHVPITSPDTFPAALRAAWPAAFDIVCEEVVYARYVHVHEGYRPSYGCIVVPDLRAIGQTSGLTLAALRTPEGPVDPAASRQDTNPLFTEDAGADLRLIVDGERTFLIRDPHGRTGLGSIDSPADDLALLELCRRLTGVCVQRQRDGRIQLLMEGVVCINEGYDWRSLQTARQLLPSVLTALSPPAELLEEIAVHLSDIMDLCVHTLSPRGIGATLVWQIATHGPAGAVSNQPHRPPADLNLFDRQDRYSIVALLASVDGACFVSRDGHISGYWAMLDPSTAAKALIGELGGTRHTSAKRYAFDEPGSLIIVVSADGPVSIFSDGAMLARLADPAGGLARSWLTRLTLAEGSEVDTKNEHRQCARCGKNLRIEVDTHHTASDTAEATCPVCQDSLATYNQVLQLRVHVIKDWGTTT